MFGGFNKSNCSTSRIAIASATWAGCDKFDSREQPPKISHHNLECLYPQNIIEYTIKTQAQIRKTWLETKTNILVLLLVLPRVSYFFFCHNKKGCLKWVKKQSLQVLLVINIYLQVINMYKSTDFSLKQKHVLIILLSTRWHIICYESSWSFINNLFKSLKII